MSRLKDLAAAVGRRLPPNPWTPPDPDVVAAQRAAEARAEEARAALELSEERLRTLVAATTKVLFVTDASGAMVPSESWENYTGQRPEEYTGEGMGGFEAVHPEDRAPLKEAWEAAVGTDARWDSTYRLRRADGEHRRVRVSVVPLRDPQGRVREWFGAIADIEEQERAREVERNAGRLSALSAQMEAAVTLDERARAAVEALAEHWGVAAAVVLVRADGRLELAACAGAGPPVDLTEVEGRLSGRWRDATHSGDGARPDGPLVLPLSARNRVLGALVLDAGGELGDDSVLATEVAARLAVLFDNARMYEHERDVSHTLQVGLLSGAMAHVDGALLSSSYRPGTDTLEVGGDWYDVFELPGPAVGLVVGDVVGHGIEAAVAMGQLRGAVRALAPGSSPAELLRRLDAFVHGLPSASMATLAYVELDLVTGRFRFACAGHPPPLVLPAEGEPRFLWDGRSTPLGCEFDSGRDEDVGRLAPDECLVLYTDGLVERRAERLDLAFQRLAERAGALRPFEPMLAERLADAMLGDAPHEDDACSLVVQFAPAAQHFSHSLVATPGELSTFRARFRTWLGGLGLDEADAQAVLLAVSEAVTNAMEHGYDFDGIGITTVDALHRPDGELRVTVRDEGGWKAPRPDPERGRGTPIMRTVMDEVVVDPGPAGTTVRMVMACGRGVPG